MNINRVDKANDPSLAQPQEENSETQQVSESGIAGIADQIETPNADVFSQAADAGSAQKAPSLDDMITRFKDQFVKLADQGALPADGLKASKANPSFPWNFVFSRSPGQQDPQTTGAMPDPGVVSPERVFSINRNLIMVTFDEFTKAAQEYFAKSNRTAESDAQAQKIANDFLTALQQNPPDYQKANELIEELKKLP